MPLKHNFVLNEVWAAHYYYICNFGWLCNLTEHLTNVFLQMQITYKLLETLQDK